jgi:hypothetical protein
MQNLLGIALATAHDDVRAATAFRAELAAARVAQDEVLMGHAHCNMAEIMLRLGDIPAAARHQRACLESAVTGGQTGMIALALLGAARVASGSGDDGDWWVATALAARADAMQRDVRGRMYDTDNDEVDAFVADARRRLGQDRYAARWEDGLRLDADAAVDLALRVLTAAGGSTPTPPSPRRTEVEVVS